MGEMLFDKVQPIIWLKTKSLVSLGVTEYDINFAYTDPCAVFRKNIEKDLAIGQELSEDQSNSLAAFEANCKSLYIIEWEQEIKQLVDVRLPTRPVDHMAPPKNNEPYRETIRNKREATEKTHPKPKKSPVQILDEMVYDGHDPSTLGPEEAARLYYFRLKELKDAMDQASPLERAIAKVYAKQRLTREARMKREAPDIMDKVPHLPTDYSVFDIVAGIMMPPLWPVISRQVTLRTYDKAIQKITGELREMFDQPVIDELAKQVHQSGSLRAKSTNTTRPKREAEEGNITRVEFANPCSSKPEPCQIKKIRENYIILSDLNRELYFSNSESLPHLQYSDRDVSPARQWLVHLPEPEYTFTERLFRLVMSSTKEATCYSALMRAYKRATEEMIKNIEQLIREKGAEKWRAKWVEDHPSAPIGRIKRSSIMPELFDEMLREFVTPDLECRDNVSYKSLVNQGLDRQKRGITSEIIGELSKQAIGAFTGNIVSNLITTAIEIINPYSNTNRIGRLETALGDMKNNFELQKQVNRGIVDHLDKLSNVVQETVKRMEEHLSYFPAYTWLSSLIVNKIAQSAMDLQRVVDEAARGRMAIEPLFRLTGITHLRKLSTANTEFLSVSRLNDHAINLRFRAVVDAPDTFVYRVHAFDHLDNLDAKPRRLHYNGESYLIYNETANCIKSLGNDPPAEYVGEQCVELDGEDPLLNSWQVVDETDNIEKWASESAVKKTLGYNFINCFPGNITIDGKQYRCPMETFRLKSSHEFRTAKQRHVPSFVQLNATNEIAVEVVHAGHFRDDSDVVQHLEMFDTLRKERQKTAELSEQIDTSVVLKRSSPLLWALASSYLASVGFSVFFGASLWLLKSKATQPSAPTRDFDSFRASTPNPYTVGSVEPARIIISTAKPEKVEMQPFLSNNKQ